VADTTRVAALRLLAMRRLTEAQLWQKLEARGYPDEAIADANGRCKSEGYIDDRLFATLYVEGTRKPVGDARLIAELVKRGVAREVAHDAVASAPSDQVARVAAAYAKLTRTKPDLSYQSAARALERLGFPTSLIYRVLREAAASAFAGVIGAEFGSEELVGHTRHATTGWVPSASLGAPSGSGEARTREFDEVELSRNRYRSPTR
jgi:SOS response regulatory protein OraA/RecX